MTSNCRRAARAMMVTVSYAGALIGFFLGFGFGVGCALAVMYSIYMGGYRKAVSEASPATERFLRIKAKLKD